MTTFADLGLIEPIVKTVTAQGYTAPTPIQAAAIPLLLKGRDVLGIAQTGTGKTAAFSLPLLQHLYKNPVAPLPRSARALILAPTRELAVQIGQDLAVYSKSKPVRCATILGGVNQGPQVRALSRGVDVLVATPGRLMDLINQKHLSLKGVEFFIIDEADRMFDMGFINDVRKIVAQLSKNRQTLLFSATMPPAVADLARTVLNDFERVEVTPVASTASRIEPRVLVVSRDNKRDLLHDVLKDGAVKRAIIFTRTKHGANRVAEQLQRSGISADAIHGNKSQGARQKALNSFRDGSVRALVATDIAARGIDVDGVTHVINYELPNEPESYVHRIGRTARAGAEGIALSFCEAEEVIYLKAIERTTRTPVTVVDDHGFHADAIARLYTDPNARLPRARPPQRGGGRGGNPSASFSGGPKPAGKPAGTGRGGPRPARPASANPGNPAFIKGKGKGQGFAGQGRGKRPQSA